MIGTHRPSTRPAPATWPDGTMSAIALVGPHAVAEITLPIPAPAAGTVLIRPRHVGLCGTDLELFHGDSGYLRSGRAHHPHTFGHEWWGEVVAVADDVRDLDPGDPVIGQTMIPCGGCGSCRRGHRQQCRRMTEVGLYGQQGASADFIRLPAHTVHRLPPRLAEPWAVLVEPAVTVVEALRRAGARATDRVAVLGTGTIGLLAVQLALRVTASVTALGVQQSGLAAAARYGAVTHLVDDAPDTGFSLVIEASGAAEAFPLALDLTERGGRVAVIGVAYDTATVTPGDLALRGLSVLGIQHGIDHYPDVIGLFDDGAFDGAGLLAPPVPRDRAADAFALLAADRGGRPKVVLDLARQREATA
ncbi:alcohol dehydrogenase catalytic domain-containing protein [Micromonospora sp. WMMD1120]|uniref:zinc-dependent alcohol dehydrogenase n=1 Tax=Micromonospora sp. WMMD1120 TaxID=3016106 RepID=UPI002417EAE4|nr:alcohol dehydrogenase catalytic domain-containing protein [Micromonospora sp. WMMD1120]MDG4810779.1 alcohol dehydrogenase catalytic domain-containing protein [Micromonospora sp. WMMD1120]